MESDAFRVLVERGKDDNKLVSLIEEILRLAGAMDPRPVSISRDIVLKAVAQLETAEKPNRERIVPFACRRHSEM